MYIVDEPRHKCRGSIDSIEAITSLFHNLVAPDGFGPPTFYPIGRCSCQAELRDGDQIGFCIVERYRLESNQRLHHVKVTCSPSYTTIPRTLLGGYESTIGRPAYYVKPPIY